MQLKKDPEYTLEPASIHQLLYEIFIVCTESIQIYTHNILYVHTY